MAAAEIGMMTPGKARSIPTKVLPRKSRTMLATHAFRAWGGDESVSVR
jgi:hypothetical protein